MKKWVFSRPLNVSRDTSCKRHIMFHGNLQTFALVMDVPVYIYLILLLNLFIILTVVPNVNIVYIPPEDVVLGNMSPK